MTKIQQTLDFPGNFVKHMYFVPLTGKSYDVSSKNNHKLLLSGDLETQGELFINVALLTRKTMPRIERNTIKQTKSSIL